MRYTHSSDKYNCEISSNGKRYDIKVIFKAPIIAEEDTYYICDGLDVTREKSTRSFRDVINVVKGIKEKTLAAATL